MSDEITKSEFNCSARELVGSIQILLNFDQWNDFTRLQAIDDPQRFIADVFKHADSIQKEDDAKGGWHIVVSDMVRDGANVPNRINAIKAIRQVFGWGLGDSKAASDGFPGTHLHYKDTFVSQEAAQASAAWKELKNGGVVCTAVRGKFDPTINFVSPLRSY
jgi:ribosomal protein L7/L12